jgi:rSAM/selenodomain-associated transferase 1
MSEPESWMASLPKCPNIREVLIIFTRYPVPGTTKTRLIPVLGAKGAALLQRRMTEQTIKKARQLQRRKAIQAVIAHAGGNETRMRSWLGEDLLYMTQGSGSIGTRMCHAFSKAFRLRVSKAIIIGTDIPHISADLIWRAFQCLEWTDLVLGPATDGGYYLIGMDRAIATDLSRNLFDGVDWGTERVLDQTLSKAQEAGYRWILLDKLQDVDRPEDLVLWPSLVEGIE